jgi:hypothetical protein
MQHYPSVGAGRRSRESERRRHKITVRLSEAELATLTAAAGRAGLALGAYIVRAGVDAAEHRAAPIAEVQREALLELIRAVELAYRVGVNLEQVVARLNATGEPGPDLGLAVADCMQVVHRIDEAAQAIVRCLKLGAGKGTPGGFQRRTPLARPRPSSLLRTPWSRLPVASPPDRRVRRALGQCSGGSWAQRRDPPPPHHRVTARPRHLLPHLA